VLGPRPDGSVSPATAHEPQAPASPAPVPAAPPVRVPAVMAVPVPVPVAAQPDSVMAS
jgi:hypothetical protein